MTGSLARLRATALASLYLGLTYWLGATSRTASDTYDGVRFLPIWLWGLALTLISLPLWWGLLTARRWPVLITSSLAFGWHLAWAVCFAINAAGDSNVAWAGAGVFAFLAYLHFSLAQAEGVEIAKRGTRCG